jgi:DNA-binding NarL/FixJ family response regulator
VNILLVDDHAVVRAGLRRLLSAATDSEVVEAGDIDEASAALEAAEPDVLLLDLNLGVSSGLALLQRLRREQSTLPVLILSMHADAPYVRHALDAGANGYVSKNAAPQELLHAVAEVAAGRPYVEKALAEMLDAQGDEAKAGAAQLSARDLEIVRLLAAGRSLTEIAASVGIAYKTVANSCVRIKAKLGVSRTADLVRVALETGVAEGLPPAGQA